MKWREVPEDKPKRRSRSARTARIEIDEVLACVAFEDVAVRKDRED